MDAALVILKLAFVCGIFVVNFEPKSFLSSSLLRDVYMFKPSLYFTSPLLNLLLCASILSTLAPNVSIDLVFDKYKKFS